MIEWILILMLYPFGGSSTATSIPGFQSIEDCRAAGVTIDDALKGVTVKYVCIQQYKR